MRAYIIIWSMDHSSGWPREH